MLDLNHVALLIGLVMGTALFITEFSFIQASFAKFKLWLTKDEIAPQNYKKEPRLDLPPLFNDQLNRLENWRRVVLWVFRLGIAATVGLCCVAFYIYQSNGLSDALDVTLSAALLLPFSVHSLKEFYNEKVTSEFLKLVAQDFGLNFENGHHNKAFMDMFAKSKIIPNFDEYNERFRLTGYVEDNRMSVIQAKLHRVSRNNNRKSRSQVFNGLLVRIELPVTIPAFIYVCPDAKLNRYSLGFRLPKDAKRCALEDPNFENAFEVFTNDQIIARTILTPRYMEKFSALTEMWRGAVTHGALFDTTLLISLNRADLFPEQRLSVPLTHPSRMDAIRQGFDSLANLIDAVSPYQRNAQYAGIDRFQPNTSNDLRPNTSPWESINNDIRRAS